MPSCSSARRRSASVRGLMPLHERSSWENRRGPSERSWTSRAVHLAPMISAQAATAQVAVSWTGFIVRVTLGLYAEAARAALRGLGAAPAGAREMHEPAA